MLVFFLFDMHKFCFIYIYFVFVLYLPSKVKMIG